MHHPLGRATFTGTAFWRDRCNASLGWRLRNHLAILVLISCEPSFYKGHAILRKMYLVRALSNIPGCVDGLPTEPHKAGRHKPGESEHTVACVPNLVIPSMVQVQKEIRILVAAGDTLYAFTLY